MKRGAPDANHRPDKGDARRLAKHLIVGGGVLGLILVAATAAVVWPRSQTVYTDADTIKEPATTAQVRDILWQPPVALPELINSAADEYEPRISADGLTLYFVRGKAGHNADIYFARKTHEGWTESAPLVALNSAFDELGAQPSADGTALYFYSDRPGGFGGYDLWVARRGLDGRSEYGEAINLGPAVNSEFNDYGPALTADGEMLYFASNRPDPGDEALPDPDAWPGTIREDLYHRTYDIYMAPFTENNFGQAQRLDLLNTGYNEGAPAVSPFGDFVYFASDRPDGEGGYDLYRTRRLEERHEPPTNLGLSINTAANELDPGLTLGGYALFFSSDRPKQRIDPEKPNPYQVYQTTSREVFRDRQLEQASINWAALWSAILPNLLWALLALLLLLIFLLAFDRGMRNRKLSLLMRCLLASLALHMLLMLLFNVWEVTGAIARELGRKGPIQIALIAPAKGDDIVSQIRGEFTEVEAPSAVQNSLRAESPALPMEQAQPMAAFSVEHRPVRSEAPMNPPQFVADAMVTPSSRMPPVQPSLPAEAVPTAFQVELPAETRRSRETERAAPAAPAPAGGAVVERPEVSRSVDGRSPDIPHAALAPAPGHVADAAEPRQSLASSAPAHDASVSSFAPAAAASRKPPSLEPMPALDLAVPATERSARAADDSVESAEITVAAATEPTRRMATNVAAAGGGESTNAELAPESAPVSIDGTSLAGGAGERAADARVATAAQPADAPTRPRLAAMRLDDLALPSLDEPRAGTATDPAPTPAPSGVSVEDVRPPVGELLASAAVTSRDAYDLAPAASERDLSGAEGPKVAHLGARDAVAVTPSARTGLPRPEALTVPGADLGLRLPTEVIMPDDPYAQRAAEQRLAVAKGMGGTEETEKAVQLALKWLAAHQSADGRWDGADFDDDCGHCGGTTDVDVESALTGLALLCFLAADHTQDKDGPYRETVEKGLQWLIDRQKDDGDLRGPETMYSQGIATIALAEALGMTKDPRLKGPVQRAAEFIENARNGETGGWRYDPGQPGDTSVLGWQVMALKSARTAGAAVSMDSFWAASRWLDGVSSRANPGLYAYQPGRKATVSMTAEGLFIQQMLGRRADGPRMRQSVNYVLENLPDWDKEPNTYYWYYGTLALFHRQGEPWQRWNEALMPELLTHQRRDGAAAGSWDPAGEWAETGGRVYQTALCTLMLEVYYRYLPLLLKEKPADAIGTIRGFVRDASTDEPLPGATVKLDLPDRPTVEVTAGTDGRYELFPPEVPPFFALSAINDGYVPASKNVATIMVEGTTLELDFALDPETERIVAIEAAPEVHHLGDNAFSGRINSQFQKRSEGAHFSATFTLSARQLPPHYREATVTMLVKGVQMSHRIRINGQVIDERLDDAPSDGSFGEFIVNFDPELLREGRNRIEILASSRGGDVDDFEFVNLQIRLAR